MGPATKVSIGSRWYHIETKEVYTVLITATRQSADCDRKHDNEQDVVYQGPAGRTWVRSEAEFLERFLPYGYQESG